MRPIRSYLAKHARVIGPCAVVLVAVLGVGVTLHVRAYGIDAFVSGYVAADDAHREEIATSFLDRYPAAALLASLDRYYESKRQCHTEAHPLGRALYKKDSNLTDVIRQCGNGCSYGCFHGALMEMFKTDSDTLGGAIEEATSSDYLARVQHDAKDLCTQPSVRDVVHADSCYHGVGHVFTYFSGGNMPAALRGCDQWHSFWPHDACASGAFMEYFFGSTSSAVLNTKGIEPCDRYAGDNHNPCMHYKAYGWIAAYGGARPALLACRDRGGDRIMCMVYVALAEATRHMIVKDSDIDALCGGLDPDERTACVTGAFLRLVDLSNGDHTVHACDLVTGTYHDQCVDITQKYVSSFGD